jgi:uncharacterized membrane protein
MINWDHKAWIVCERIVGLITLLVLAFFVWNTLIRIEKKQAENSKQVNQTLEAIRERMDVEEWQKVEPKLKEASLLNGRQKQ